MRINEIMILVEDRLAFLEQHYGDKIAAVSRNDISAKHMAPGQVIKALAAMDPTKGKLLQYLVIHYTSGEFRLEDKGRVGEALASFIKLQPTLQNKDINQYKSIHDLFDAVEGEEEAPVPVSGREKKRQIKQEGATPILKGKNFLVLHLTTGAAGTFYASGTKWCTSNDKTFQEYAAQGEIYLILVKDKNGATRKFQFHYSSGQLMNEKNREPTKAEVNLLSSYPEWYEFVDMMVAKHHHQLKD